MKVKSIVLTLIVGLCGCHEPTVWSTETSSPDGQWIAKAYTVEHGGFGTAGVDTNVTIEHPHQWRSSTRVLGFMNGGNDMDLKMKWISPTQLEVTYCDSPEMLFYQVVKTSGVEILVRVLPTGKIAAK